jgi:hypothetical protein
LLAFCNSEKACKSISRRPARFGLFIACSDRVQLRGITLLPKLLPALCSFCIGLGTWAVSAQTAVLDQAALGVRYLFVVDSSKSMAPCKDLLAQTVASRIRTGINGQIRPGELFAVWTFNQKLSTDRYLPMVWLPQTADLLADRIERALANQAFEGEARLDPVIAQIAKAALFSDSLTVFLLSDGSRRIQGTPFDEKLNAACGAARSGEPNARRLFVTTLFGRTNRLIGWSLDSIGAGQMVAAQIKKPADPAPFSNRSSALEQRPYASTPPLAQAGAPSDCVVLTNSAASIELASASWPDSGVEPVISANVPVDAEVAATSSGIAPDGKADEIRQPAQESLATPLRPAASLTQSTAVENSSKRSPVPPNPPAEENPSLTVASSPLPVPPAASDKSVELAKNELCSTGTVQMPVVSGNDIYTASVLINEPASAKASPAAPEERRAGRIGSSPAIFLGLGVLLLTLAIAAGLHLSKTPTHPDRSSLISRSIEYRK